LPWTDVRGEKHRKGRSDACGGNQTRNQSRPRGWVVPFVGYVDAAMDDCTPDEVRDEVTAAQTKPCLLSPP
jgi:hypothetical protein